MSIDQPDFGFAMLGPNRLPSIWEHRSILENHGPPGLWDNRTGDNRRGKFFPRGCRGFIETIDVYCRDAGLVGGTITVYICPQPGMGPVYNRNIVIAPGGPAAWRSATFNLFWNYDSLFIFWVGSTADMQWYQSKTPPYDAYDSANAGATWTRGDARHWVRVVMAGETAGDVPVSGTLNTIKIPSMASGGASGAVLVPNNVETDILTILGAGRTERICFYPLHSIAELRIYVDGVMIPRFTMLAFRLLTPFDLTAQGYTATTPQIQVTEYNVAGGCAVAIQIPFEFRRSIRFTCHQLSGAPIDVHLGVIVNELV